MKTFTLLFLFFIGASSLHGQDFAKAITTAQSAYGQGKLEDTHFALQQAMQEIDLLIGREVLKLLPPKMDNLTPNIKADNVSSNIGFIGATIHRSYGMGARKADLSIISNSPLVAMMNTFLNTPLLGGMMSDGKTRTVKVQGYKARLEKLNGSTAEKTDYELQLPLGSALITFKVNDCSDAQILDLANTLPLKPIAQLIE